jgi:ADP-ribosylglycohydrolase
MRILPVAMRYTDAPIEEMLFMAHRISALTHRHPRSQMACGLYCIIAKGLLYGLAPGEAYRFMIEQGQRCYNTAPFNREMPHFARIIAGELACMPEEEIASSGYVVHTLEASLWCLLTTDSFEDAILTAVNLGDDTDTTGCVAGGLAGLRYGTTGVPASWIEAVVYRDRISDITMRFINRAIDCHLIERP